MNNDKLEFDKDIENDFAKVKAEVTEKLKEAAKLIRQADTLAENATGKCLAELADEYNEELDECLVDKYDLFRALDNCGWRTSSLSC